MIKKTKLLESLQKMPENISVDELIDRIILLHKIETGLIQADSGKGITTDQLRKRIKKWSK